MHLVMDAAGVVVTCVVSLWREHKMFRKSQIAIQSPNTFYDVPAIEFEVLFPDPDFPELERRPAL